MKCHVIIKAHPNTIVDLDKKLPLKHNLKSDLKRQIKLESDNLRISKEHNEKLESMDDLPEDIRKGIVDLNLKGIASQEKRVRNLDRRIKG